MRSLLSGEFFRYLPDKKNDEKPANKDVEKKYGDAKDKNRYIKDGHHGVAEENAAEKENAQIAPGTLSLICHAILQVAVQVADCKVQPIELLREWAEANLQHHLLVLP